LATAVGCLAFPGSNHEGVLPALLLVALNGCAAHVLYHRGLRAGSPHAFLAWTLGGGAARTLTLLVAVFFAHLFLDHSFMPFLAALGAGYIVCLSSEIAHLHARALAMECAP
jgi:hypothetical protein